MRRITKTQAQACEDSPVAAGRCKCRCGGELHGARRGPVELLPLDDPHFPYRWQQLELDLAGAGAALAEGPPF